MYVIVLYSLSQASLSPFPIFSLVYYWYETDIPIPQSQNVATSSPKSPSPDSMVIISKRPLRAVYPAQRLQPVLHPRTTMPRPAPPALIPISSLSTVTAQPQQQRRVSLGDRIRSGFKIFVFCFLICPPQCFWSIFIESGSCQKSESRSRRLFESGFKLLFLNTFPGKRSKLKDIPWCFKK